MLQSHRKNEINHLSLLDSIAHHETNESQIEIDLLQRQTGQTEMLQSNTNEENIQLSLLHTLQSQDLTENSIQTNQQCTQSDFHHTNHQLSIHDAVNFLNTTDPSDRKWSDFKENPTKSLLLWYANAGCFAFDEYKEYSLAFHGKPLKTEALQKEINDESLSVQELGSLIKKFHSFHSYTDGNLYACASCGIRQLEQLHPKIEYASIQITDDLSSLNVLRYTEDQTKALCSEQQLQGLQIPLDDEGHFTTIHPWQVCSVYESPNGTPYHLHPELVDVDEYGNVSVHLCPICMNKINKKIYHHYQLLLESILAIIDA